MPSIIWVIISFLCPLSCEPALSPSPEEVGGDTSFASDDECAAAGFNAGCSFFAAQLRARKLASHARLESDDEPSACTRTWKNCVQSKCCSNADDKCYAKDHSYAQCRPSCVPGINLDDELKYQTPWSCDVLPGGSDRRSLEPGSESSAQHPRTAKPETANINHDRNYTGSIVIKGNFLYDSAGSRFFAKGIAYNPRNINYNGVTEGPVSKDCAAGTPPFRKLEYAEDVATDDLEDEWRPNLEAIKALGVNTVRLYNIDPDKYHKKFMQAAEKMGLYVIIPLTRKDWGYLPAFPSPDCYTRDVDEYGNVGVNLLTSAKLIVKQFSEFPNTLMFTVANEMPVNDKNGYAAYPCVKALTRDIHRYQASCHGSMRRVPLIYSDMDMGAPTRGHIANYLACSLEDDDDAVDAYGLNVYSWCDSVYFDENGRPSFRWSPYQAVVDDFAKFSKPLLFTEFGCDTGEFETACPYKNGRTWSDIPPMFKEMAQVLSGAIAFEFSMEQNQFGIVLTPGFLSSQDKLQLLDSYYALQEKFETHEADPKWDGIDVASCLAVPSDIAPMSDVHTKPQCPPKHVWQQLQWDQNVDSLGDWSVLPPTPGAPLWKVNGTTECPSPLEMPEQIFAETCCHMNCTASAIGQDR